MDNMGLYGFISVFSFVVGLVKEIVIILAIIKGIQIASVYLKKKKNEMVEDKIDDKDGKDDTDSTENK